MERRITLGENAQNQRQWLEWVSHTRAVLSVAYAAARSRIYDGLDAGPATADALAAASNGLSPTAAGRIARYLAVEGVLSVDAAGRYAHTEASRVLQASAGHVRMLGPGLEAGLRLCEALATGRSGYDIRYGMPFFEALSKDPELGQAFGEYMSITTAMDEGFIFANHRFKPFTLAVDVGGSLGSLMIKLLTGFAQARGILFDLPETVQKAKARIAASPVADRVEIVGGSFFEAVPAGGDLYLMKQILHDWDDVQGLRILKSVRAAIAPGGRLIVIDRILPEELRSHSSYDHDISMLTMGEAGGERRLSQFEPLLDKAGFKLERVTENPNGPSVIEAVPV